MPGLELNTLWHSLHAVYFMNQTMFFASRLALYSAPFILVIVPLAGRPPVSQLWCRLGPVWQRQGGGLSRRAS